MQQYELSKGVGINSNRGVKFLSNSPSSFSSAKEYFSYCQPNFINSILKLLFIFYNIIICNAYFQKITFKYLLVIVQLAAFVN